ncbi:type I-E CRISPR-associated protein Cse1/CasA [Actinomyces bowdenii]|uniref:Type I-E CRISPR-associated protein Cse1/CasA n=1 Tax=Actinomyces bowdenii TaxID=131109 RepID=A0A3P1UTF6_9ACTO|nr:type I-E CRISPR-associated protein Cse1/CasA [Actinomyces bowdenii]
MALAARCGTLHTKRSHSSRTGDAVTPSPSFSLLTQPWIRCDMLGGSVQELSLRDLFDGEHRILRIRGDSPTQDYAILRLILVILWCAHRPDEALADEQDPYRFDDWWEQALAQAISGGRDEVVLDYLERHAERFDLLHPSAPFMQVADLDTAKGTRLPVRRIIPEAEQDYFTMRAGRELESLNLAEAARWLVTAQAYDYSGIKSGAMGDPRVKGGKGYPIGQGWTGLTGGVVIHGRSLRETLILNTPARLVMAPQMRADLPVWERLPDGAAERPSPIPTGPCDLLTWQSRRIRLFTEEGRVVSVLVSNGDKIPEAGANILVDPMTPYRYSTNKSKKGSPVFYPRPHDAEQTVWRSLEPLLVREGVVVDLPGGGRVKGAQPPKAPTTITSLTELRHEGILGEEPLTVELVSVRYGPQAASVSQVVSTSVELPHAVLASRNPLLAETLVEAGRRAREAAVRYGRYAGNLLVAAGGDYVYQAGAAASVLDALEPAFRSWLVSVDEQDPDAALATWSRLIERRVLEMAATLLSGAGPKALAGRVVEHNGSPRLVSAGTAFQQLQRDLRALLPHPDSSKEETHV